MTGPGRSARPEGGEAASLRITMLGCGGSLGVPLVGGSWGSVDPNHPRNRRRRPSILVEGAGQCVLVDTSPDCRAQLLDAAVTHIDAIVFTHAHADHLHGIDDIRPFMFDRTALIPAYADRETMAHLEARFGYMLNTVDMDRGIYRPLLEPHLIEGSFAIGDLEIVPFEQEHGPVRSLGLRFGPFAYSTDVSFLDEHAFALLEGVDTWIVDAARHKPHPSHAHLTLTLEWIARVRPRRAILTHMNHEMDYADLLATLPAGVEPGYDGMVIELPARSDALAGATAR
ncbi:MAG: MBL fold metallo-hydrolase [Azospirillaceae bacterium]